MRTALFWIGSVLLTLASVYYTRVTGPTKPVRGSVEFAGETINYRFIRSFPMPFNAPIRVNVENEDITGYYRYKRTPSHDEWTYTEMVRNDDGQLVASLPRLDAGGKMAYQIYLIKGENELALTESPVVLRFRNSVPAWAMIPHILLMFIAILLSIRAGLGALFKENPMKLTIATLIALITGGLIFGPIVQKYAFGEFWTGFPFGHDLTDNKTLIMFIFWLFAFVMLRKNPENRKWVIVAAVVTLIAYIIPHSVLGTEIDFTQEAASQAVSWLREMA
jgi:hypothetical protein